jgi:hypothetical protein
MCKTVGVFDTRLTNQRNSQVEFMRDLLLFGKDVKVFLASFN